MGRDLYGCTEEASLVVASFPVVLLLVVIEIGWTCLPSE